MIEYAIQFGSHKPWFGPRYYWSKIIRVRNGQVLWTSETYVSMVSCRDTVEEFMKFMNINEERIKIDERTLSNPLPKQSLWRL